MGSFKVSGFAEFQLDLEQIANLPDSVLMEMAQKGGEVQVRKIKAKGESYGVRRTGVTLNSIKAKKPKRTGDGVEITVTPLGKRPNGRKDKRNGEVAFINNYGKRGQPARPFFSEGIAESENEAIEAAQKVYDDFLKSKKF